MDDVVCMYCMQEMGAQQDPRLLPCGHAFCLGCLKAEKFSRGLNSLQCASCRTTHEDVDFGTLPSALSEKEKIKDEQSTPTETTGPVCDRFQCLLSAVEYCTDCGEKSCAHHFEHHKGYYENQHETIDIQTYIQNPSLHVKVFGCKKHQNEFITMACERCFQFNCVRCDTGGKNCTVAAAGTAPVVNSFGMNSYNGQRRTVNSTSTPLLSAPTKVQHSYCPLTRIRADVKRDFDERLQRTYDRLGKIDSMEKAAWKRIDKVVEQCKDMLAVVEVKSAEQIQFIRQQTKQLQDSIKSYETEKTNQVLTFVSELMKKKEEIIDIRKSTFLFLNTSHTAELIEEKKGNMELLNKTIAINLGTCDWTGLHLSIGMKRELEIKLRPQPPSTSSKPNFPGYNWQVQKKQAG